MSPHKDRIPPLALLAGGLATRLGAVTRRIPKSLVSVAGEPFIAHQLRLLSSQGIRDVVLCCGHFGSMIQDYVGDGAHLGCRVRYSHDGPGLLGTGGAIRNALPLLGAHFWVLYGDSYLPIHFPDVLQAYEASGKPALMTILRNNNCWDASNVEFSEGRILCYEKRISPDRSSHLNYIDYGLSLYSSKAFAQWPNGKAFDLSEVQQALIARGLMAGLEIYERFYEIGSPSGLHETDLFLRGLAGSSRLVPPGACA